MKYRRVYLPGGTYFFTLVTFNRNKYLSIPQNTRLLLAAFDNIRKDHPFEMIAHVIMPDHIHVILHLPDGDANYSTRWRLIKSFVSRGWKQDQRSTNPFWQNRFWEHTIRDEYDLEKHMDYIHYNPVKHGKVENPSQWEHSSFNDYLARGDYSPDWGKTEPIGLVSCVTGE